MHENKLIKSHEYAPISPFVSKEMGKEWGLGTVCRKQEERLWCVGKCVWPTTCQPNSKTTNKRKEIELGAILSFHTYVVIFLGRAVTTYPP